MCCAVRRKRAREAKGGGSGREGLWECKEKETKREESERSLRAGAGPCRPRWAHPGTLVAHTLVASGGAGVRSVGWQGCTWTSGVWKLGEGEWELARWLVEEEVEALNEQHLEDGCGGARQQGCARALPGAGDVGAGRGMAGTILCERIVWRIAVLSLSIASPKRRGLGGGGRSGVVGH